MADQDFDNLLRIIQSLNKELDTLSRKIDQTDKELSRLNESRDIDQKGARLNRLEAALAAKEVELRAAQAAALKSATTGTIEQLASRDIITKARQVAQDVLKAINQEAQRAAQAPSSGLSAQVARYARGYTLPTPSRAGEIGLSSITNISHPIGGEASPASFEDILSPAQKQIKKIIDNSVRMAEAQNKYSDSLARAALQIDKTRAAENFEDLVPDRAKKYKADSLNSINIGNERERLEKERLAAIRDTVASEKKYARALEIAAQQGYSLQDLRGIKTRGTGGIEQLQFHRQDDFGRNRNLDLYVNREGRANAGVSNQFRTFGEGVVRDIGELTKWSIALAAVYGPLRKTQELVQIMIDNQTRLAEATISVNSAFIDQSQIFDIAADAANAAGEATEGVIDAFTLAYRAAGGGGNEVERLATAQNLLADSLILSKLSTLDQATAIDTLAAALRQSGGDLNAGTELLDKWVRVTKVANIDLASLATGFAVLGDAAETAGLDADQLNGILAAIGETGISSGRELANTARAMVGLFQSDQAREALERIGIAVEDTAGKAKPLTDILKEIDELSEAGIISPEQLSALTGDIGQGVRRGAQVASLISSQERIGQVAAESAKAGGDAQAALAKQLDTVQTALTRLGNAFSALAQTLGTEGGFLSIMSGGLNVLTEIVDAFDSLTSVLGKATPALAAFIATSLILRHRGQGGIQQALFGYGQSIQPTSDDLFLQQRVGAPVPAGQRARQFIGQNVLGTNATSGAFQGVGAALIPALLNFFNEDDKFGKTKSGADIAGGIVGGIIGSLAGPGGAFIGATIGVSIAEAFVNSTIARSTDIFAYGPTGLGDVVKTPGTTEELDTKLEELESRIFESVGFGSEALGRFLTQAEAKPAEDLVEQLNRAIQEGNEKQFNKILDGFDESRSQTNQNILERAGIDVSLVRQAFEQKRPIEFGAETLAFGRTTDELRREFESTRAARLATEGVEGEETPFTGLVRENKQAYESLLSSIRETAQQEISQQRISGDIRGAEYGRKTLALGGYDTKALQYYTALGEEVSSIGAGAETASGAFEILNKVIVSGAAESIPEITAINGEIIKLINLLSDPAVKEDQFDAFGGLEKAKERLQELRETQADLIKDIYQEVLLSELKVPNVQGDINKPLTTDELALVEQQAKALQEDFYKGFLKFSDSEFAAISETFEEWAQIVEESGEAFFEKIEGIDPQFFQQAMSKLLEEGKLSSQQASPFGIQQLDITSQQGAGLQGQIDYFSKYLSQNFPQYEQKPEEFGVIFSDYVTDVLHGDNLAMKLALEKLVDIGQKQLDGQYNIPEGATFWVPLTAAYYRPQNQEGLGDMGQIEGLDTNTSATDENTQALREAAIAFRGDYGYAPRIQEQGSAGAEEGQRITGYGPQYQARPQKFLEQRGLDIYHASERDRGDTQSGNAGASAGFVETLRQGANTFIQAITGAGGVLQRAGIGSTAAGNAGSVQGRIGAAPDTRVNQATSAKLDIKFESTSQLIVDGRILATIIKPYLAADLLKLEGSQGTITKRYVI